MFIKLLDYLVLFISLLPIIVQLFNLLTAHTHNKRLINLRERANIIVAAMEQSGLSNEQKKQTALDKLAEYANEVNIPVTGDQLDDYIESAVNFLKALNNQ